MSDPAIHKLLDALHAELTRTENRVDAIHELLGSMREDLARGEGRLERKLDRIDLAVTGLTARAAAAEVAAADQAARIAALERRNADQDAGDKRQRRLFAAAMTLISTVAGVVTWLAGKYLSPS